MGQYRDKFEMDMSQNESFRDESTRPTIAYTDQNSDASRLLRSKVQEILLALNELYGNVSIIGGSPFRLNEYSKGRGYKGHVDRSNKAPHLRQREISVVFGMNDDYDGGELVFPRQKVRLKLGAGDVVVFPSGYTHPHEVLPVERGVRLSIVTWLD